MLEEQPALHLAEIYLKKMKYTAMLIRTARTIRTTQTKGFTFRTSEELCPAV